MLVTQSLVKGLFRQLVQRVGGIEVAASDLGLSHQRISQLQNPDYDAAPSVVQIAHLENVLGEPVVTATIAQLAQRGHAGPRPLRDIALMIAELNGVLLGQDRTGMSRKAIDATIAKLSREVAALATAIRDEQSEADAA
jgi:hypothetical protein